MVLVPQQWRHQGTHANDYYQAFINLDSLLVFYFWILADHFVIIQNPNFEALGKDIGVSMAAAKWRFYKLRAIFEGESESPKHVKTATPKREVKEGLKRKVSEDSGDESEASLALVSAGDSNQKSETSIKAEMKDGVKEESDPVVKKKPGLNVKAESGLFTMEDYDI